MLCIRESDWKHLRQLKSVGLDRFCSRVLSEIASASSDREKNSHNRYQTVYELIRQRDRELGQMFDELKRSNAEGKIILMRRAGLLTDDEWGGFSDEIKHVYAEIEKS